MTDKLILPFRGLDLRDLPAVGGDGGLEVYVMCEIPNNGGLSEFSELFDGCSIGSNDEVC